LRDVSFTIKPGQLVVIVGTNGSGKSTILKLLTGLHDCTSGQVTINGRDIADYRLESLRSATAILTQDHRTFPLSLSENIGIGNPQAVTNIRLVRESARKGGAEEFISSRANQYDTILDPMAAKLTGNLFYETDDTTLNKIYKGFEKKTEISGSCADFTTAADLIIYL
jgi:ABC-type multidrug transport system fused ATPase/permease subunit